MNKLVLSLIIIVTLFTASGCSEKFNVAAPYKNITVIYAFLDRADTAHYIRIQKAFLDQNKNALAMAQEPDSNFYANLNVRISRLSVTDTNRLIDTIHLSRVDLNVEGYPKQPGVFFNAPNYAYKFKGDLDPNYFYRIVVTNLTTGQKDSSISPVIDDVTPGTFYVDALDDMPQLGLDFASTQVNQNYEFKIIYKPVANFNYFGYTSPAYMAYTVIRFNYYDSNIVTHDKTPNYYDYAVGNKTLINSYTLVGYKVPNLNLYSAVATGIGVAPENTVRLLDRCDMFVYLTTVDYFNYQQASATQGVGLTGNEIHPVYTNVKGANALGLYTARGVHYGKITLTSNTVDALIKSPIVANAHIVGTVYH